MDGPQEEAERRRRRRQSVVALVAFNAQLSNNLNIFNVINAFDNNRTMAGTDNRKTGSPYTNNTECHVIRALALYDFVYRRKLKSKDYIYRSLPNKTNLKFDHDFKGC